MSPSHQQWWCWYKESTPDNKVHGANMGPIWGRQDLGGPHVGPTNFAMWDIIVSQREDIYLCHFIRDKSYKMQKRKYTFLLTIQHINCDSVIIDLIDTRC